MPHVSSSVGRTPGAGPEPLRVPLGTRCVLLCHGPSRCVFCTRTGIGLSRPRLVSLGPAWVSAALDCRWRTPRWVCLVHRAFYQSPCVFMTTKRKLSSPRTVGPGAARLDGSMVPCDTSGHEGLAACFWPRPGGSQICTADPMPPGADGTSGSPRGKRSVSPCRSEPAAARTDGYGASDSASLKQKSRTCSPVSDEKRVIGGWNSRFSIFFLSLFHRLIFSKLPLLGYSRSVQLSCQRSSMATVCPQPVGLSRTSAAQFQEGPPLPAGRTDPCGGAAATGREGAGVSPAAGGFSGAHGKPAGGVRTLEERSSHGTRVRAEAGSVSPSVPS